MLFGNVTSTNVDKDLRCHIWRDLGHNESRLLTHHGLVTPYAVGDFGQHRPNNAPVPLAGDAMALVRRPRK